MNNENINERLKSSLESFLTAYYEIMDIWGTNATECDQFLTEGYPFGSCFSDLYSPVSDWIDLSTSKIDIDSLEAGKGFKYACYFRTNGNPDYGQDPEISITPRKWVFGDTIEEIQSKYNDYRIEWNFGGSNWPNCKIILLSRPNDPIGFIAYNARFFEK